MKIPKMLAGNAIEMIGAVRTPEGNFIVLAEEEGPSGIVCWMMDDLGNCFWGRYGNEALPAFVERMQRHFRFNV